MVIVNPTIEEYINSLLPGRDHVLLDMEKRAREIDFPIVGPLVGRFLCQLALITGARLIFEMGSGFGYSAYWFSLGMRDGGKVICTDSSPHNAELARAYFERGALGDRIEFIVGDALEVIHQVPGEFDIVFNDVDKEQYPRAFELATERLKKGGLLITDNVLWGGSVTGPDDRQSTRGVVHYNHLSFQSQELYTVMLPVRDGLSISLKIG